MSILPLSSFHRSLVCLSARPNQSIYSLCVASIGKMFPHFFSFGSFYFIFRIFVFFTKAIMKEWQNPYLKLFSLSWPFLYLLLLWVFPFIFVCCFISVALSHCHCVFEWVCERSLLGFCLNFVSARWKKK